MAPRRFIVNLQFLFSILTEAQLIWLVACRTYLAARDGLLNDSPVVSHSFFMLIEYVLLLFCLESSHLSERQSIPLDGRSFKEKNQYCSLSLFRYESVRCISNLLPSL